jgi:hypothetical protein
MPLQPNEATVGWARRHTLLSVRVARLYFGICAWIQRLSSESNGPRRSVRGTQRSRAGAGSVADTSPIARPHCPSTRVVDGSYQPLK